jgi:hypothetical protein
MKLTERQRELLNMLRSDGQWATPMMLGGRDGSHHSATLNQLVRKGLVERGERKMPWQTRGSCVYRAAAQDERGEGEA